jgi:hypothetical protein
MSHTSVGLYVWIAGFEGTNENPFVGLGIPLKQKINKPIIRNLSLSAESDSVAKKSIATATIKGLAADVKANDPKNMLGTTNIKCEFMSPHLSFDDAYAWINNDGASFAKDALWTMFAYKEFTDLESNTFTFAVKGTD